MTCCRKGREGEIPSSFPFSPFPQKTASAKRAFYCFYKKKDSEEIEHIYSKEQPDQLGILIEIEGIFKLEGVEGDESKKVAHVRCYDELFPYADMMVRYLALNSAMSGLSLRKQEMDGGSIRMGEELEEEEGKIIGFPNDTDEQ